MNTRTAHIRIASAADAGAIARIYAPIVSDTVISFEVDPPDRDEMTRRVTDTLRTYPWLVCEIGGQIAGYAYAAPFSARAAYRWSVTTSVYIAEKYRRYGVGRGLYASLFDILRAQGFVNAFAGITLPNAGSVGLHESLGFARVGVYEKVGYKFGSWHDVGWWQLALKPHASSPDEPCAVGDLALGPEWPSLVASGESMVRPAS